MSARCRKRKYKDEIGARLALAVIDREDKAYRPNKEVRAYECPRCGFWHLSHIKEWKETNNNGA